MKAIAVIQARLGSSRLPGKVLAPLLGKPMLQWQLERLAFSKRLSRVAIATSTLPQDDLIAEFCRERSIACYRGSELDVLDRFHGATLALLDHQSLNDATIIRLTGDCPLIDPYLLDDGIDEFSRLMATEGCRYLGYAEDMPDGMNFEIFTWQALDEAQREARDPFEREHVTPFLWRNPARYGVKKFGKLGLVPGLHFSVDNPQDLELVREILSRQEKAGQFFGAAEVSELFRAHPELRQINGDIVKNEGLFKTALASDRYRMTVNGKPATIYGALPPAQAANRGAVLDWCRKIGLDVWQGERPAGWTVVLFDASWQKKLESLGDAKGILLQAESREDLAKMLTYLCRTRFTQGQ